MGLSGRSVGLSGRALCGVLSVVIAVGLGAGTGVAAVAADAALAASRAAARSSRPGLFVGVGLQGSWSEFLVFDLVCGIDLWIGSYGGESKGGIFGVLDWIVFPIFRWFLDWPMDTMQVDGYDMIRFESVSV